jgi:hypothetical protein
MGVGVPLDVERMDLGRRGRGKEQQKRKKGIRAKHGTRIAY